MIAHILTTLAVFCLALSVDGLHLRSDTALSAEDQATAQHALRSFMKSAAKQRATNRKVMDAEKAKLFSVGNHKSKALDAQQGTQTIEHGYLVSRYRPNADCSGRPTTFLAQTGECRFFENEQGEVYSEAITCTRNKPAQELMLTFRRYNSNDCSGEPHDITEKTMDKCAYDEDNAPVPGMVGVQCVGLDELKVAQKGGVVFNTYLDAACSAQPDGVTVSTFGGCELSYNFYDAQGEPTDDEVFNQYTTYYYVRLDGCHDTHLMFSAYQDPACTRQIFRVTVDAAGEFPYGTCAYQDDWERYATTVCVPAPAHM
jgi:hypothetical protein